MSGRRERKIDGENVGKERERKIYRKMERICWEGERDGEKKEERRKSERENEMEVKEKEQEKEK